MKEQLLEQFAQKMIGIINNAHAEMVEAFELYQLKAEKLVTEPTTEDDSS